MQKAIYAAVLSLLVLAGTFFVLANRPAQAQSGITYGTDAVANVIVYIPSPSSITKFYKYDVQNVINNSNGMIYAAEITGGSGEELRIKYLSVTKTFHDIIVSYLKYEVQYVGQKDIADDNHAVSTIFDGSTQSDVYFYLQKPDGTGYETLNIRDLAQTKSFVNVSGSQADIADMRKLRTDDYNLTLLKGTAKLDVFVFNHDYISSIKVVE